MRTMLRADIERALALLEAPLTDEAIHRVRQALKRARAALRLLREAISEAAYARENGCLRDAARPLAAARDAKVMLDLVDEMLTLRKMHRHRSDLVRLCAPLRKAHARQLAAARAKAAVAKIRRLLEHSLQRIARWRLPSDPRPIYRNGLRRIYAKGRSELRIALEQGTASALHEWRKQVKYLGAALAIVAPARRAKARKAAAEIASRLGDDRDLAMLAAILRRSGAASELLAKIEKKRGSLQKRSIKLARRLYKRAPDRFIARIVTPPEA
jgi:hypothetical protein